MSQCAVVYTFYICSAHAIVEYGHLAKVVALVQLSYDFLFFEVCLDAHFAVAICNQVY